MAIAGRRVTVPDTATVLVSRGGNPTAGNAGKSVAITNRGGGAVDLGGSGVTSGGGYQLASGETVTIEMEITEEIYAISAAAASNVVHVLEQSV